MTGEMCSMHNNHEIIDHCSVQSAQVMMTQVDVNDHTLSFGRGVSTCVCCTFMNHNLRSMVHCDVFSHGHPSNYLSKESYTHTILMKSCTAVSHAISCVVVIGITNVQQCSTYVFVISMWVFLVGSLPHQYLD